MERHFRSALIAAGLLLLQTTFIPAIAVAGYLPDVFMPWLVYCALRRRQMEATVTGFSAGLLQDLVSTKFMGLAALSKTVASFVAGYFFNENTVDQTLGSYRFVLIVAFCSFIHNVLYFSIALQGVEEGILMPLLQLTLGNTIYTTAVSVLPMFAFSQKFHISWSR